MERLCWPFNPAIFLLWRINCSGEVSRECRLTDSSVEDRLFCCGFREEIRLTDYSGEESFVENLLFGGKYKIRIP